ncbi:hypothetical protein SAMD00019534_074930 [Acytostelium subglobosum LB1]|uniref:hypothetical protein n=1 Tax=Acytostelium subglobosum LB1 TaxID=1410327 RepID=UPI000644CB6F|nr:hypothetical protein SAMD00019534_074930 [Acytostelium subglobosum LB1]GAM24318.1 hypothetical protein SAMD00019534_074930 [Acytostelium subglobosum LB1]|eukprot:XP_012752644.1 hypothetical protein SAMD00019534_074930 [Acytostelium subglobosum LB1]
MVVIVDWLVSVILAITAAYLVHTYSDRQSRNDRLLKLKKRLKRNADLRQGGVLSGRNRPSPTLDSNNNQSLSTTSSSSTSSNNQTSTTTTTTTNNVTKSKKLGYQPFRRQYGLASTSSEGQIRGADDMFIGLDDIAMSHTNMLHSLDNIHDDGDDDDHVVPKVMDSVQSHAQQQQQQEKGEIESSMGMMDDEEDYEDEYDDEDSIMSSPNSSVLGVPTMADHQKQSKEQIDMERERIKQTLLQRRSNIISQPMLEQLSQMEERQTRPRRIAVGRRNIYSQNQIQKNLQLNSANLFNNLKAPILSSAKVNPSLYVPTTAYGYYKDADDHVYIKREPINTPSPLFKSAANSKSGDLLALEDFLAQNNTSQSQSLFGNQSSSSPSKGRGSYNGLMSVKKRRPLENSNYSVDSASIPLRTASGGIKTNTDDEMDTYGDDERDEIDHLYQGVNNSVIITPMTGVKLNTSTQSTTSSFSHQVVPQMMPPPNISPIRPNGAPLVPTTTITAMPMVDWSHHFAISNDSVATNKSLEEDEEEDYCGSDIDGEDFSSVNIDYNERFQEIMEDLRNIDCNAYQKDRIRVNSQFIALTQDFIYASQTFAKVIISERYLPNTEKTIPPIDIGGLAGGDKFIVHGILFKFAIDKENFYGSDYAASCVAGHELKGLINVFNSNSRDLSLPLMALVDYRGFRVIAMSILPVEKDTICYGSNDYGMTIHNSDKVLSDRVMDVARQLNIKSHHCGEAGTYLHSPADLEGHNGFDGRYYLLDFARIFPPEAPSKQIKMGHLYRLLRPEFVRNYKYALCSDSFSRFIKGHNDEEHNRETVDATMYLFNTTIPELAEELNQIELVDANDVYHFPIPERVHKHGVNVRYLGHVRKLCETPDMKSLIFVEMCARVVKQQLRQKLRFKMKQARIPLEAPYRRLIVAYLNRVLGTSDKSDDFWDNKMKKYLMKKFDKALFDDEIQGNSIADSLVAFSDNHTDGKYLLFKRIQKMTGLKFSSRINEEFLSRPNTWLERGEYPLDINDLEEIGIRVKYIPFHNVAQGYLFKVKGELLFSSDPIAASRFFNLALEKLETALETDPNNTNTLCTMGEVYLHLGEGSSHALSELSLNLENPLVAKAYEYLGRAIFSNRTHTMSLFRFAQLLERLSEFDRAEEYYIASLESNPNNIACLQEYGNFLQTARKDPAAAEPFFVRVSENHQYLHVTSQRQTELNLRGSSGLLKVRPKMEASSNNNALDSTFYTHHKRSSSTSSGSGTMDYQPHVTFANNIINNSSSTSGYQNTHNNGHSRSNSSNSNSSSSTTSNSSSSNNLLSPTYKPSIDKSKSSMHLTTPAHMKSSFPSLITTPSTPPSTPRTTKPTTTATTATTNGVNVM